MSLGGFENNHGIQPMAEINTTPLVDVMLVLLVIFIITAPLFQQAIPIDLPQNQARTLDESRPKIIRISIDANGTLFIDGAAVPPEALASRLQSAAQNDPELHLRADRAVRYERVADVMAAAQYAGIGKIAFVTEPAP